MLRIRSRRVRFIIIASIVAGYVAGTILARRRGYNMGGTLVVRCRQGHLFSTIWIPGASLKAIRLGWFRLQRCPVGHHWSLVSPVRDADLNDAELRFAREHRDLRIP
jgi:hypothetical protein